MTAAITSLARYFGMFICTGATFLSFPASAQQKTIDLCKNNKTDAGIAACTELIRRGGKEVESYYYYRSIALGDKGECDRALADAEKAVSLRRDMANLQQRGVVWLDCKKDNDRAIEALSDAIRAFPKAEEAYYHRSRARNWKGECDPALEDIDKAIALKRDAANLEQRGMVWLDCKKDNDRALTAFNDALKAFPQNASIHRNRSRARQAKNECDLALADADKAISLNRDADTLAQRASVWLDCRKDTDRALNFYDEAIRAFPESELLYYNRSIAWERKGDCNRALADAEKALSLLRDESNVERRALVFFDCFDDDDRALAAFNEALRIFPKSATLYSQRGNVFNHFSQFENALADFDQALRLSPGDPNVLLNRGKTWISQEDWDKAIADFTAAVGKRPEFAEALSYRGVAYGEKGDQAKALADLELALRLEPNTAQLYLNRATQFRLMGDYERALADHDRSISLLPEFSGFYGQRSRTFLAKGDLDRALADANEAVRREKGNIWSQFRRGVIYRYRGDYDRSLADLDQVLRRYPYDAESYVERGRTYEKKGDLVRARADFTRALKERGTLFRSAHEAARAQLAALDAAPAEKAAAVAPLPSGITVKAEAAPAIPKVVNAGRRVALVIGNADYAHVAKLSNPGRDAQVIAAALRGTGFQTVTVGGNLTRERLTNTLQNFAREAEGADWAVVYFAGHGIEIGGVNYLIPVDAKLGTDRDAQFEAVSLEQVLASVEGARKIKMVILDACRDNPFATQMRRTIATRSVGRGLSRIEPEGATLVVYAAKHGQTALDGDAGNSPFAAALAKRMMAPGVEINKVFRLIRDDVMEVTAGRQEPFTYGSLPGREDFYFVAGN